MKALRAFLFSSLITLTLVGCNTADLQVAWVISSAEGEVATYCAASGEAAPTALDMLEATGVDLVTLSQEFGTAVCKIGDVGRPADPCFGDFENPEDPAWIYFVKNSNGDWEQATVGVDAYEVQDGEVLSFIYTGYTDATYIETLRTPPDVSFEEVCGL